MAKAMKVKVADDSFESIMAITGDTAPDSKSLLLVDIENDRKNEIETLSGTLVKFAQEHNVDVLINKVIYGAIKLLS